jgi:hypothetical protein
MLKGNTRENATSEQPLPSNLEPLTENDELELCEMDHEIFEGGYLSEFIRKSLNFLILKNSNSILSVLTVSLLYHEC